MSINTEYNFEYNKMTKYIYIYIYIWPKLTKLLVN